MFRPLKGEQCAAQDFPGAAHGALAAGRPRKRASLRVQGLKIPADEDKTVGHFVTRMEAETAPPGPLAQPFASLPFLLLATLPGRKQGELSCIRGLTLPFYLSCDHPSS